MGFGEKSDLKNQEVDETAFGSLVGGLGEIGKAVLSPATLAVYALSTTPSAPFRTEKWTSALR